jgi:hypothetical protein
MLRLLLTIGLAAVVLSGCADLVDYVSGDETPKSQVPEDADAASDQLAYATAKRRTARPPPLPLRKPPVPDVSWDIERLVGMDFVGTEWLLGEPALEEVKPPAKIWSYNGSGCVLSIFFFPHVADGDFRALTYEVKGSEAAEDLPRRCFAELLLDNHEVQVR